MFIELEETKRERLIPDAEASRRFWSDVWDLAMTHGENTDLFRNAENELGELTVQDDIHNEIRKVRKQIRKMRKSKIPRPDDVQKY